MSAIAFQIGPLKIHWYGIFYLVSFIFGYFYIRFILKKYGNKLLPTIKDKDKFIEDLFIATILGVLLGGRLGHVIIYNLDRYLKHPFQIIAIWNGGMSFVGGVIGVSLGIFYIAKKYRLNLENLLVLSDLIVLVVPFGIMLGRIGNFLNQELYGKIVPQELIEFLGNSLTQFLSNLKIFYIYNQIDTNLRINTNFIESILEGLVIFIILNLLFWKKIKKGNYSTGQITGLFLILYGIFRFFAEILRYYPPTEFIGPLTKTQWIMILFIIIGVSILTYTRVKHNIKNTLN